VLNENEKEACTRQTLTNKQSINTTHSINQSRKTHTHATQSQSIHPSIHPSIPHQSALINQSISQSKKDKHAHSD
jgi:hypothetical protein